MWRIQIEGKSWSIGGKLERGKFISFFTSKAVNQSGYGGEEVAGLSPYRGIF